MFRNSHPTSFGLLATRSVDVSGLRGFASDLVCSFWHLACSDLIFVIFIPLNLLELILFLFHLESKLLLPHLLI